MLSKIADICGIVGFLITVRLLFKSDALQKEIENQRSDYMKEQRTIRERLISLRMNIVEDNLINMKVISDLRTQLFSFKQKFKRLLNHEDKTRMKRTLKLLKNDTEKIDKKALCVELDYFVARFERKERK